MTWNIYFYIWYIHLLILDPWFKKMYRKSIPWKCINMKFRESLQPPWGSYGFASSYFYLYYHNIQQQAWRTRRTCTIFRKPVAYSIIKIIILFFQIYLFMSSELGWPDDVVIYFLYALSCTCCNHKFSS